MKTFIVSTLAGFLAILCQTATLSDTGISFYWGACGLSCSQGNGLLQRGNLLGIQTTIATDEIAPYVVDFDSIHGKVYWLERGDPNAIRRANADGSNMENIVPAAGSAPSGLQLDPAGNALYWSAQGDNALRRADLDGSHVVTILSGTILPSTVVLDVPNDRLFFVNTTGDQTQQGAYSIERISLSGQNRLVLVDHLIQVTGFDADPNAGKMYWADLGVNGIDDTSIKRANLDGSQIEVLLSNLRDSIIALRVDPIGNRVYWTSSNQGQMKSASLDGKDSRVEFSGLNQPQGLALTRFVIKGDCVPASDGLVGWWPGDGNANDIAGVNNGTVINAGFSGGTVDQAFSFSGNNAYVQVPTSPTFAAITNSFSLEAWVWQNQINDTSVFQRFVTITPDNVILALLSGRFRFSLALAPNDPTAFHVVAATNLVESHQWYHLVATYDGTKQSLYVDGTLAANAVVGPPLIPIGQGAAPEIFISFLGEQALDGKIDEAAIYNRALTDREIQAHFTAGSAGMCKVPVFTEIAPFGIGSIRLDIKGLTGKGLIIQSSTNLIDWPVLESIPNFKGFDQVFDSSAGRFDERFYRAVMP